MSASVSVRILSWCATSSDTCEDCNDLFRRGCLRSQRPIPGEMPVSCTGDGQISPTQRPICDIDDMDMDEIADADDQCPMGMMGLATIGDSNADTADPDMDGCKNQLKM